MSKLPARVRHTIWGIGIGLAAAALFVLLSTAGLLDALELKSYDWRMAALKHAPRGSGQNVALLYVDEPSLRTMQTMGISWPWPRELYAGALDFARRGGARAVVFDLFFSEDSSYGVPDDEAFGRAIAEGPPSYFVLFASKEGEALPPEAAEVLAKAQLPIAEPLPQGLPVARSLQSLPITAVRDAATGFGNAQTPPDDDGIFRRTPLLVRLGERAVPQIAFKVVSDLWHTREIEVPTSRALRLDGSAIPLDASGNLLINYIGGVDSYPAYPLGQVLIADQMLSQGMAPDLDPSVLADRVVIIGVAAPGLYDLKPSPLSRVYPGPEVHATIVDSLLRRDFLTPLAAPWGIALTVALALAAAVGLANLSRISHIVLFLAGLALFFLAAAVGLFQQKLVIPVVAPIGALSLGSFAMILRSYLTEGRRRHAIKRAFGQYLSPAVVSEIAQDPDNVRMGGLEQEVSVFFSDIADFTSISERMQPTELVAELCRYLTHATKIITDRHGTLDKYIGDAVMAFWGAPLAMPDHASRAVLSALEVQRALVEFPQFATRIGIHTGRCVVGNIGSDLRFNYTAIGDTVNLASRLEGLNKQFGTKIIVSEATYEEAKGAIEARCLGRVRVKGRAEPIAIYQPLAPKGGLSAEDAEALECFDKAMMRFRVADFLGAAALLEELPDVPAGSSAASRSDSVVAYYRALCHRYAHESPRDFDGVIVFTEK